jgi:hypothetical protein
MVYLAEFRFIIVSIGRITTMATKKKAVKKAAPKKAVKKAAKKK